MDPITRKETFLAKAGGQDVTTPTPVTREEYFLNQIAKGGGHGGVLVVNDINGTLNKTWTEIDNAIGAVYIVNGDGEKDIVLSTYEGKGDYYVAVYVSYGHKLYVSSSADGYPVFAD